MSSEKSGGIPPWVYIGCGCLGAILAIVVAVVGLGAWGVHKAREFGEAMEDPVARTDKALEVLGADELPEGYHAVMAVSIPFVMDVAILSDMPAEDDGRPAGFRQSGFIYMNAMTFGQNDQELTDFFAGKGTDLDVLRDQNIELDLRERVASGSFERDDASFLWVSHRGAVDPQREGDSKDGIVTLLLVDCELDERRRLGIWFGADPAPDAPADSLELAGSVADPANIEAFWDPLRPCR